MKNVIIKVQVEVTSRGGITLLPVVEYHIPRLLWLKKKKKFACVKMHLKKIKKEIYYPEVSSPNSCSGLYFVPQPPLFIWQWKYFRDFRDKVLMS